MTPLPASHHPDDTRWITEQLMQLPSHMRQGVCDKYSAAYRAAYEAQGTAAVFAEGPARREANTRLREFVARVLASLGGVVQAPPSASHHQSDMAHSVAHTGTVAGRGTAQGNGARSASLEMAKGKSLDRSRQIGRSQETRGL